MTPEQAELLTQARDSLAAAKMLFKNGYPAFAASRAYYTMFYIAEAFLEGKGLSFSKHSAVIAAFGQHFAHTGEVPAEFHRFLLAGQEVRHVADYGPFRKVTPTRAYEQITRAERFMELAAQLIGAVPSQDEEPSS
jgi:uncharacterized protein (UPF0332 family)